VEGRPYTVVPVHLRRPFFSIAPIPHISTLARHHDHTAVRRNPRTMAWLWVRRWVLVVVNSRAMGFNHHRGQVLPDEDAFRILSRAIVLGCTFWDTACIYGYGANEELLGRYFKAHPGAREKVFLASKCGLEASPLTCRSCRTPLIPIGRL